MCIYIYIDIDIHWERERERERFDGGTDAEHHDTGVVSNLPPLINPLFYKQQKYPPIISWRVVSQQIHVSLPVLAVFAKGRVVVTSLRLTWGRLSLNKTIHPFEELNTMIPAAQAVLAMLPMLLSSVTLRRLIRVECITCAFCPREESEGHHAGHVIRGGSRHAKHTEAPHIHTHIWIPYKRAYALSSQYALTYLRSSEAALAESYIIVYYNSYACYNIYVCIYIYIYTHTYIYTYTHHIYIIVIISNKYYYYYDNNSNITIIIIIIIIIIIERNKTAPRNRPPPVTKSS